MKKNNPKYKRWLKKRNLKLAKKKAKENSRKRKISKTWSANGGVVHRVEKPNRKNDYEKVEVKAPENFSLIYNTEEVTGFFDGVKKYIIASQKKKAKVFFDLSSVKSVTIDAIMYLLAIIKNLQNYGMTKHNYAGNMPNDVVARSKIMESGFFTFVNSRIPSVINNANKITIRTGQSNDSKVLKEICDFIINKGECTQTATKGLYVMMAEMMYNTSEHAYTNLSRTMKNWYIFVEYENEKVKITFMDTGLGIPKTMRKNFGEKFLQISEDKLIVSALKGEFRSQTKLPYRNNGLPTIRKYSENQQIENLHILSNKAVCAISIEDGNLRYKTKEQANPIMGTIYYWEIPLNKLKETDYVNNKNSERFF